MSNFSSKPASNPAQSEKDTFAERWSQVTPRTPARPSRQSDTGDHSGHICSESYPPIIRWLLIAAMVGGLVAYVGRLPELIGIR
jgi:hypothetical protein